MFSVCKIHTMVFLNPVREYSFGTFHDTTGLLFSEPPTKSLWKKLQMKPFPGPNLDHLWVWQSDTAPFLENYTKLYFDAKHLENRLSMGWQNFCCPFFFFFKKVSFLANIGCCPDFLDWAPIPQPKSLFGVKLQTSSSTTQDWGRMRSMLLLNKLRLQKRRALKWLIHYILFGV